MFINVGIPNRIQYTVIGIKTVYSFILILKTFCIYNIRKNKTNRIAKEI